MFVGRNLCNLPRSLVIYWTFLGPPPLSPPKPPPPSARSDANNGLCQPEFSDCCVPAADISAGAILSGRGSDIQLDLTLPFFFSLPLCPTMQVVNQEARKEKHPGALVKRPPLREGSGWGRGGGGRHSDPLKNFMEREIRSASQREALDGYCGVTTAAIAAARGAVVTGRSSEKGKSPANPPMSHPVDGNECRSHRDGPCFFVASPPSLVNREVHKSGQQRP